MIDSNIDMYDVVQFKENHKWCGNLGIIYNIEEIDDDIKYKVGVATIKQKMKYIYVLKSQNNIEKIGTSYLYVKR